MTDDQSINGEWVEIAEKSSGDTIVFRRSGPDIPPARGGRRQLHLRSKGEAETEAPGPTDRSEMAGTGTWSRDGSILHIGVPGWEGDYEIKTMQDDQLILRRR